MSRQVECQRTILACGFDATTKQQLCGQNNGTSAIVSSISRCKDHVVITLDCDSEAAREHIINMEDTPEMRLAGVACAKPDVVLINFPLEDIDYALSLGYRVTERVLRARLLRVMSSGEQVQRMELRFLIKASEDPSKATQKDTRSIVSRYVKQIYEKLGSGQPLEELCNLQISFIESDQRSPSEILASFITEYTAKESVQDVAMNTQTLEIFKVEQQNQFGLLLEGIKDEITKLTENQKLPVSPSASSVSVNQRAIQQQFPLGRLAQYLQRDKPFEQINSKECLCLDVFMERCIILKVKDKQNLVADLKYNLDRAIWDFGCSVVGLFHTACRNSFDKFHEDFVEHFKEYLATEQPFKYPMAMFNPISAAQIYIQQTIQQINALLLIVEGPIAAILKHQVHYSTDTPQKYELELNEEEIYLQAVRSSLDQFTCAPAFMRVSTYSLNHNSITESYGVVSEALVTGLYWLCSRVLGQDVLNSEFDLKSRLSRLVVSALYELIQYENSAAENFFKQVQEELCKRSRQSLKEKVASFLDTQLKNKLCERPMDLLSTQRDEIVFETTQSYIKLLQSYLRYEFFDGSVSTAVLFSCRSGGDKLQAHLEAYERFSQSIQIKTPSFKRTGCFQEFSQSQFKYVTTQSYDIQALALLDQEYQLAVTTFVDQLDTQAVLEILIKIYQTRMTEKLGEQRGLKFPSLAAREQWSQRIEQDIVNGVHGFGGPLISSVGLESITIPGFRTRDEIIEQFHNVVIREMSEFPVFESYISWGAIFFMAFLARRDITAAFKNKFILTLLMVVLMIAIYAHKRRGLGGFIFETQKLYSGAVASLRQRDWQQINKALEAWLEGLQKWWQ